MTEPLLSAKDLTVRFGGVVAVDNVSFDVQAGEIFTLIGPNGAGKTTVFNLISRIYTPTEGEILYQGERLTTRPPHDIAALGIARTFQNIELFEHASVLHNLLIGGHTHRQTGFWSELFFTKKTLRAEIAAREKAERVIDFLDLQHHRESLIAGLPYGVRKVVELARAHGGDHILAQHQMLDVGSGNHDPLLTREATRLAQVEEAFYFLVNAADCLYLSMLVHGAGDGQRLAQGDIRQRGKECV